VVVAGQQKKQVTVWKRVMVAEEKTDGYNVRSENR
jgi:ATP-dependent RNA circularization protein (DNA/RNA ligase family)